MIVFLTSDLMMSSSVSAHARENDIKLKTIDNANAMIKFVEENRPLLMLIDLQTPKLDVEEFGQQVRGLADSVCPITIAYAQHVNVDLLKTAKEAGFDQVMTRGQFNSGVAQIVSEA
jgi:DNA-binding response OmpR family regulator